MAKWWKSMLLFAFLVICVEASKHQTAKKEQKSQSQNGRFSFLSKLKSLYLSGLGNVICPDGVTSCNDGYTCCLLSDGRYGCCPYPNANCCNDHIHCCPYNYYCQVPYCNPRRKFEKKTLTLTKTVSKKPSNYLLHLYGAYNAVICPDKRYTCPGGHTCCKKENGEYACCPFVNAGCCSDGVHCCPKGFYCDYKERKCNKELVRMPLGIKTRAKPIPKLLQAFLGLKKKEISKPNTVNCSGGIYYCKTGETCCLTSKGVYACCPLPNAVCCSDHQHCCQHGTKCDVKQLKCVPKNGGLDQEMLKKHPAQMHKHISSKFPVQCPYHTHYCPAGSTCCLTSAASYGCCPVPKAVCCEDEKHCCPENSECFSGKCAFSNGIVVTALVKMPAKPMTICPDGHTSCPDSWTCCKSEQGYGCCPLPDAVCCDDLKHCCENGYECTAGVCHLGTTQKSMVKHVSGYVIRSTDTDQIKLCSDGKTKCDESKTCCDKILNESYCCPFPNAVCCLNNSHCCPQGFTCSQHGICNKNGVSKSPFRNIFSQICPDGVTECPSNNTCCKLSTGGYGCCPLPQATCCSDDVHCCPNGYSCSAGYCVKGDERIEASRHTSGIKKALVVCPDGVSQCPSGSTCCKLSTGGYGCCPLPKATCCSDGVHCCPNGYSCSAGSCVKGKEQIEASKHTSSIKKALVVCPDGTECATGSTCCKLSTGGYGCCPLPQATCCSDGVHCCPNGYSCSAGYCVKGDERIEASRHTSGIKKAFVLCPDGVSQCPSGSTCCKLSTGGYGCCPLLKATCCSDGVHCCPNGYSCSGGFCTKGGDVLVASKHFGAISFPSVVVCPDKVSQCSDGSTCCRLSSGAYGCCPLRNAVCCDDHVHCCPGGYRCSGDGYCEAGTQKILASKTLQVDNKKVPALDAFSYHKDNTATHVSRGSYYSRRDDFLMKVLLNQMKKCPNGKTTCKQYETCCGSQCCPYGNDCSKDGVNCQENVKSNKIGDTLCPDGKSKCLAGTSCCLTKGDVYQCCPIAHATCCDDGVHCCPKGWNCLTSKGLCKRPGVLSFVEMRKTETSVSVVEEEVRQDGGYVTF